MTWGNLKKGDSALVVYCIGERTERVSSCTVLSVGPKWITVRHYHEKTKFDAEGGYGEYGYSLHTEATLAEKRERIKGARLCRRAPWETMPIHTLRAIVELIEGS